MAIRIVSVDIIPQSTTVSQSILISVRASDNDWQFLKDAFLNWQAIKDGLVSWAEVKNY